MILNLNLERDSTNGVILVWSFVRGWYRRRSSQPVRAEISVPLLQIVVYNRKLNEEPSIKLS